MEVQGKACTRCHKLKSLTEFYRQGTRHESLCKTCKKSSRAPSQLPPEKTGTPSPPQAQSNTETANPQTTRHNEREAMPVYDESIFYPEEARRALGISDDDMDSVIAYFRWQLEQREKRKRQKEKV